jgi:hypothetical protein
MVWAPVEYTIKIFNLIKMKHAIETLYCNGSIDYYENDIIIDCVINDDILDDHVHYIAPSPPKYNGSFSGSGLPYFSETQAYQNTPNVGSVRVGSDGKFTIQLIKPNSYYVDFDKLTPPSVEIVYNKSKTFIMTLDHERISYRTLSYPPLRITQGVEFYNRVLPVRSQERILRDSDYNPNIQSTDFWGLKPPL